MADQAVVAIAMSGGVDSSVAAALLVERGYPVFGIMLRLWSEPGNEGSNRCCTPDAINQARRVAAKLGIPFYAINAQEIFHEIVVQSFLDGYSNGVTPNPCVFCNRSIRWDFMLKHAQNMGAEKMATGHYARLLTDEDNRAHLHKGVDDRKDQSYVLSVLDQNQLQKTLLPLGSLTKVEVREQARRFGLSVADRSDSQDLCFLAGRDYRQFLSRYAPEVTRSGKIIDTSGKIVGEHQGLGYYTIGQRKGLGISSATAMYVLNKRIEENVLVVGQENELGNDLLIADEVNWISGIPPRGAFTALVKIRYKALPVEANICPLEDGQTVRVEFFHPARDITPGQRIVFYQDDEVLGGGTIRNANRKQFPTHGEGQ